MKFRLTRSERDHGHACSFGLTVEAEGETYRHAVYVSDWSTCDRASAEMRAKAILLDWFVDRFPAEPIQVSA